MFINLLKYLLILTSLVTISSTNPIYAILALIFVFCETTLLLMYLEIDFLALVFLVVYVGAIAVLFLFVIMLLNVELTQSRELKFLSIIPFTTFLMTFFFLELLILLNNYDFNLSIYNSFFFEQYSLWINNLIGHSLIETIGFILYSYFWLHLTMSALILLVAMIGAILLTLEIKKDSKYNNISVQILRSYKKKL